MAQAESFVSPLLGLTPTCCVALQARITGIFFNFRDEFVSAAHLPVIGPLVLLDPGLHYQLPTVCPTTQSPVHMNSAAMY